MIQEAQEGVGISGKEGRQIVNASDCAVAQFRYLNVYYRNRYRHFRSYLHSVITLPDHALSACCCFVVAMTSAAPQLRCLLVQDHSAVPIYLLHARKAFFAKSDKKFQIIITFAN
jgi:hypothetical protein